MSSFFDIHASGEVTGLRYQAPFVRRYGADDRYSVDIPAYISFKLAGNTVFLTIEDAQGLLEALPGLLAQHEYSEFVTDATDSASMVPKAAA